MSIWSEAMSGAGGGLIATVVAFVLGQRDSAQTKRDDRTKEIIDLRVGERIKTIETDISYVKSDVQELKSDGKETQRVAQSTNDLLNELARNGRLHIRDE